MSGTQRHITPGWDPDHKNWSFGPMTEKYQSRDKSDGLNKQSKNKRFSKDGKNSYYNLSEKINQLRMKESLEDLLDPIG